MENHNKIAPPMGSQTIQTLSAIESVSRDLSYRIAEQAEMLEEIINGGAA